MSQAPTSERRHIVVGIDHSDGARHALTWADQQAQLKRCPLDVVCAWEMPVPWAQGYSTEWAGDVEALGRDTESAAIAMTKEVLGVDELPEHVRVQAVEGPAASVLIKLSDHAELLVVGTRGRGGFARMLLGSVSNAVAHHAGCPVVIVPATPNQR